MFTCSQVKNIFYYTEASELGEGKVHNAIDYYVGSDEAEVVVRRKTDTTYEDETVGTWQFANSSEQMMGMKSGTVLDKDDFQMLSEGKNPEDGEYALGSKTKNRKVAYDLQLSAPKSFSVFQAIADLGNASHGNRRLADVLNDTHREAVEDTVKWMVDNGLILTRRGKGGKEVEVPSQYAFGKFNHSTSRAGDPHIHTHSVLMNICVREDGTIGTLDNKMLLQHQQAINEVYNMKLRERMKENRIPAELEAHTDPTKLNSMKIAGLPEEICDAFSKRREDIKDIVEEFGGDKAVSQVASYQSRQAKSKVPGKSELKDIWQDTLGHEFGFYDPKRLLDLIGDAHQRKQDADALVANLEDERHKAGFRKVAQTVVDMTRMNSTFTYAQLTAKVFQSLKGEFTVEEAEDLIGEQLLQKNLIPIGYKVKNRGRYEIIRDSNIPADGEPVYSTPSIILAEKKIVQSGIERKGTFQTVPSEILEKYIYERTILAPVGRRMTEEQAHMVRHACNSDGISIVEGYAGTGKSFSMKTASEAFTEAGFTVHGLAPSHKAKDVLRNDTGIDESFAKAVQGFINRMRPDHPDHIPLSEKDVIMVDEAGMIGTEDMKWLLFYAERAGAKVILAGDTKQIQPVSAGSPMSLLAQSIGTQRIETIRRQHEEWMVNASLKFASLTETSEALQDYYDHDRVHIGDGAEDAMEQLVDTWMKDVQDSQEMKSDARLIITEKNADVNKINDMIRERKKEAGLLTGEEFIIKTYSREVKNRNNVEIEKSYQVGQRVIFGEAVLNIGGDDRKKGVDIYNSDMGIITGLVHDPKRPGDPVISLKMDKGIELTCHVSELVGKRFPNRETGEIDDNIPKMQFGDAVTIHASQGTTVDNAYVYSTGMGAERIYVAMTRHRKDCNLFIDGRPFQMLLDAKKGEENKNILWNRDMMIFETGEDAPVKEIESGELEKEDIFKMFQKKSSVSESQYNVTDYVDTILRPVYLKHNDVMPTDKKKLVELKESENTEAFLNMFKSGTEEEQLLTAFDPMAQLSKQLDEVLEVNRIKDHYSLQVHMSERYQVNEIISENLAPRPIVEAEVAHIKESRELEKIHIEHEFADEERMMQEMMSSDIEADEIEEEDEMDAEAVERMVERRHQEEEEREEEEAHRNRGIGR